MALRFKPVDNVFYELLTESATRLVEGADILAEMLGEDADLHGHRRPDARRRAPAPTRRPTRSPSG